MKHALFIVSLLILFSYSELILRDRCCQINLQKLPRYKLSKINARSTGTIISSKFVSSIKECIQFAMSKKALAFNYETKINNNTGNNLTRFSDNTFNQKEASNLKAICQALQCPDTYNFTTLIEDKNYQYFSMYSGSILSDENTLACIPKAGIFVFSNNVKNYTQARASCQKLGGSLAHIISEERTEGLAKYITHEIPYFIGLANNDNENIWKNIFDEPLSCFEYRAWGEREPSNSRGCVTLVKSSKINSFPFWKVVPCHISLPFICEIFPKFSQTLN